MYVYTAHMCEIAIHNSNTLTCLISIYYRAITYCELLNMAVKTC